MINLSTVEKPEKENEFLQGKVLLVNKPYSWTSFDVVRKIRNSITHKYNIKKIKVGHAGTLDPLATGLMILCTGKATKRIQEFLDQEKEYIADIEFGKTTPSFDLETDFDVFFPYEHISKELVERTLQKFTGEIEQMPPIFSAKKIEGKKAYNLARKGETPEIKPVKVYIKELEILHFQPPELKLRVVCSKGTYIRSLAHDMGASLDSGAYLKGLIRTKIGSYSIDNAEDVIFLTKKILNL